MYSISDLYKNSFKIFVDNIVVCVANTFILLICSIFLAMTIIGLLLIPALFGGYLGSMIKLVSNQKVAVGDFIKKGINHFGPLLGSKIFYTIITSLGLLFFIIPGIYLMIKWFFVTQIIINENLSVSDAYSKSSTLSNDNDVFWTILTIIVINLLISTLSGWLFFFSMPFISIVCAKYYLSRS